MSTTAECYLSRKYGLRVGAPYGGVCLPKDVPELTSLAPEGSVFREFLSGTGKINEWIANTPNLKVFTESRRHTPRCNCSNRIYERKKIPGNGELWESVTLVELLHTLHTSDVLEMIDSYYSSAVP